MMQDENFRIAKKCGINKEQMKLEEYQRFRRGYMPRPPGLSAYGSGLTVCSFGL